MSHVRGCRCAARSPHQAALDMTCKSTQHDADRSWSATDAVTSVYPVRSWHYQLSQPWGYLGQRLSTKAHGTNMALEKTRAAQRKTSTEAAGSA